MNVRQLGRDLVASDKFTVGFTVGALTAFVAMSILFSVVAFVIALGTS